MNETAYPLYWPARQKRTPAIRRYATAPFSTGETQTVKENRWIAESNARVQVDVKRKVSKKVTIAIAVERLDYQLMALGAELIVLSTNLELRLNGSPRSGQGNPADPGAAVWFNLKGKRMVFACDKWEQVADNIAALAAHIRAIRSVENFGVGTLEQAFAGYRAIENFSDGMPWRRVLGFKDDEAVNRQKAEERYREHAKRVHPDLSGEHGLQMSQLNLAIAQARAELGR